MGHVLATSLQLKDSMDTIFSLSAKKELTEREKLYVEAIKHMSARYCFFLQLLYKTIYPFKPQYPHTNSPNWSLYISFKN